MKYINEWNGRNLGSVLLFAVLFCIAALIIMFSGNIHPVAFLFFSATGAIILPTIYMLAARRVAAPGVPTAFTIIFLLVTIVSGEYDIVKLTCYITIAIAAELNRYYCGYNSLKGLVFSSLPMPFVLFSWPVRIWITRDLVLSNAKDEMPAGYDAVLNDCSPLWVMPIIIVTTVVFAVIFANLGAKIFKIDAKKE